MTSYKSEGWIWSNQTTTGCGNCYYYWNGGCAYGGHCYGTEMRIVNGNWVQVPIGAQNKNYDNIKENESIFGDKK